MTRNTSLMSKYCAKSPKATSNWSPIQQWRVVGCLHNLPQDSWAPPRTSSTCSSTSRELSHARISSACRDHSSIQAHRVPHSSHSTRQINTMSWKENVPTSQLSHDWTLNLWVHVSRRSSYIKMYPGPSLQDDDLVLKLARELINKWLCKTEIVKNGLGWRHIAQVTVS
jgi:hypothetical protein